MVRACMCARRSERGDAVVGLGVQDPVADRRWTHHDVCVAGSVGRCDCRVERCVAVCRVHDSVSRLPAHTSAR